MLKRLQQLIQAKLSQPQATTEQTIEGLSQSQTLSLILMVEIALADGQFSADEHVFLRGDLMRDCALTEHQAEAAIKAARQEVSEAASLQHFTAPLKDLSYPDKIDLLENLWRLAYADNMLDPHEESMLRKLADLLYISHADFIKTKLKVAERL